MDFRERYLEMIDEYIRGSENLDEIFQRLVDFTKELQEEEQRYIREGLENEEELAVYDLLLRLNLIEPIHTTLADIIQRCRKLWMRPAVF
jgi:type I restriction enzyme R subunit